MDGMNVKSLEERSEGDVASPSSTGTQVQKLSYVCHLSKTRAGIEKHVICYQNETE